MLVWGGEYISGVRFCFYLFVLGGFWSWELGDGLCGSRIGLVIGFADVHVMLQYESPRMYATFSFGDNRFQAAHYPVRLHCEQTRLHLSCADCRSYRLEGGEIQYLVLLPYLLLSKSEFSIIFLSRYLVIRRCTVIYVRSQDVFTLSKSTDDDFW
jgi:hypothetical protein